MKSKRTFRVLIIVIISILCTALFLSACSKQNDPNIKEYTITFETNGGSAVASITKSSGEKITAPKVPTKTGYTFDWWYLSEEASSEKYIFDKMPEYNFTLYAKWSIVNYDITYELNGGSFVDNYPTTYNIESDDITLITPTKENLIFGGWYLNTDFTGEPVTTISKGSQGNKTFHANWNIVNYDITYELNGGLFNDNYPITYNIESDDITLIIPTKENLIFGGWYLNAEFTGEPITTLNKGSQGNKTFYAKWNVIVTFDSMGGSIVAPRVVLEGTSLDIDVLSFPTKDGYVFTDWYIDEDYTEKYLMGVTLFTQNTILYAEYSQIVSSPLKTYFSDETTYLHQEPDFSVNAVSSMPLNNDNIDDIITLSSSNDNIIPELKVIHIEENKYRIEPLTNFDAGGSYLIEISSPNYFNVEYSNGEDTEYGQVNKIYFTIKSDNISEVNRKEGVILIERTNYYSLSGQTLYLKQSYAFENNIQENSILKIVKDDGAFVFGKVTQVGISTVGGVKAVVVNLSEVDFNEAYDEVDIYENIDLDIKSYLDNLDLEALAAEMANDENYQSFQQLTLCAVADYVNDNKISKVNKVSMKQKNDFSTLQDMAYIDVKHSTFSLSKDDSGTLYILASFRVVIDKNTYVTITVDLSQYFTVNLYSSVKVRIKNWYFDVGAYIGSSTTLDFSIILNLNGKEYDIKKILNNTVDEPTPEGFVADYKRNLNMDTDSITLFSKQLIRPKYTIGGILEVAIPININLNVDINAAFSSDIDITISKEYGIKGEKGKGVSYYKHDGVTKQKCDLYYSGYIGLEVGISASLELCFNELDFIGRVGLSIEVGAYFDFYGYGKTYYSSKLIDGNSEETTKVRGGTCWEVGIYLKLSLYAASDIFSVSSDVEITKTKIPLLEGGNELIAYDFNDDIKEIEYITVTKEGFDLNQYDYRTLDFINLKTGKTISKIGDEDLFLIMASAYFTYDENTGKIMVKEKYDNMRHDSVILIKYLYDVYSTKQYIEIRIPLLYIPEYIDVPTGDLFTKHTVDFKINGILYKSVEVYSGGCLYPPYITKEWLSAHPEIALAKFNSKLISHKPIFEDCVYEAYVQFKAIEIQFNYAIIRNNIIGTYNSKGVGYVTQDKLSDLESQLFNFSRTPLPNYTFIGWDYTGDGIVDSDKIIQLDDFYNSLKAVAIYEDTPFDVYLHIDAITNNKGEIIVSEQTVSDTISIGETPSFTYETIPGYYLYVDNKLQTGYYPCFCSQTFEGTLERNEIFKVTVYDANNNILIQEYSAYTDDKSSIMNSSAVINYVPVYTSFIPEGYEAEFVGWSNVEFIKSVKFEIDIYPIFDFKLIHYSIKFDGGEGEIPYYNQYLAENGVPVYKGEQLSEEFIAGFTPTKQSSNTCDYQFDGWYYNDVKGVKPATESITYVARFIEVERKYKVIVLADYVYQQNSGTTINSITINGTFSDGTNSKVIENLTYTEALNLCNEIENGNYENSQGVTQPTSTNSRYVFKTWNTSLIYSDKTFEVIAQYKQYNYVRLGLDAKEGSFNGLTSNIILWTEFQTNKENEEFIINQLLKPYDKYAWTFIYNEEINQPQQRFGAYVDENYLYNFKGWSLDKETVLALDYTLTIPQNEEVILTAIYDKTPIAKTALFKVNENDSTESLFIFEDNTYKPKGTNYSIIRNYGTKISKDELPIARKTLLENTDNLMEKYLYEYTYEWKCVETGEIVEDNFDINYTYEAVFSKVSRQITITLNAVAVDEATYEEIETNFVFSNGQSSIDLTVDSGTVINELLLEIPTCDDETIIFRSWNYYLPIVQYENITITARFYK